MPQQSKLSVPPPIVALAGWLVPGWGYWLIGHRGRALTIGVTIVILFVLGLLIGGLRVIDPPAQWADQLMTRFSYLAGPMRLIAVWFSRHFDVPLSHGRVAEIGTLYTAVAGMLNLLAIIDAAYRSGQEEPKR